MEPGMPGGVWPVGLHVTEEVNAVLWTHTHKCQQGKVVS